ncbi:nervous system adducin isoform X6 [Aplysia californica]|uniref:Nervous system adducin isoform X6 n=1 Tax=Aplysia californica TaxID=6500 RepID=A0ABM1VP34_APLCA|nr:nervous system adducin isoform X6 [Aplysia californica]
MSEAGPQVNGPASPTGKYIETIDPDDPEYVKYLQRPAEVKEDLQQMENRSRVSVVLNSQAFKDELEEVVEEQLRSGPYPASLIALQQITDLLLPHSRGGLGSLARASTVIPINDLRGVESLGFAKGEKLLRCKLAALYRLMDLCGWSHGIYNHISARVSSENEHFLLNPFGMLYSEVTASSLVKVDVNGDIFEPGSTPFSISKAGFTLHAAIHQARPDIKCIIHLHTPAAVAVSSMKCGFLPMSQEALICGNVSYHEYRGILVDAEEKEKLSRNLGVHNKILFLHNHGVAVCGETIEEAFHFVFNVMAACEAQVSAMPAGLDNIILPGQEARDQAFRVANQGGGGVESTGRKWKIGELEFEALMRTLDNSGYRTGYVYKMPVVKSEKKDRSNSEVEIPPASSSFTYVYDGDYEHSKYASPLKAAMERQKKAHKTNWLTTPNTYKKTEVEEIGTTTPKKITKWVPGGESPGRAGGSVQKVENPNQFAPQGANPKEFKEKQKSDGQLSGAGDQLIVMGAASKGIIQRDHQHNAVVYRQYYAANPFENMSEAEIEKYQSEVQKKEQGEPVNESVEEAPSEEPVPQPPPPSQPEQPDTEEEARQPEESSNGYLDTSRTSQSSQGPHEEDSLARLADKVVRTVISDALSVVRQDPANSAVKRSESERQPSRNPELVEDLDRKNVERSKSDRKPQLREELGEDKPASPAKSDTLRSTDSASGGETLEERSSKEGSPTKEHPSPTKDKKKKKKFRMPSFSKKKNKESKESAI